MKPILFNTKMIRAILDGRKTVTRRVIKRQPELKGRLWTLGGAKWSDGVESFCPMIGHSLYSGMPYKPGDVLYVRETWGKVECRNCPTELCSCCPSLDANFNYGYIFRADDISLEHAVKWRPSIHMPKEAARIFLRVTDVSVERLQAITPYNAHDEGIAFRPFNDNFPNFKEWLIKDYREIWDSTIKKSYLPLYSWDANPWVWVIEFERCKKPCLT